jgi:N utilization substance protein B
MSARREIRRLAMQVLYQLDVNRPPKNPAAAALPPRTAAEARARLNPEAPTPLPSVEDLAEGLDAEHDSAPTRRHAAELALGAWAVHPAADEKVAELAPDWPTHRQPPVDRAILRLAYYEITSGHAPPKVAINEAIELAKQYCAENAPAFINGILDKLARQAPADSTDDSPAPPPAAESNNADAWLDDAVNG